jgi:hypothetical protein
VVARILRWLEWVANPALAGAAFLVLCLGVVTWLPALAAAATALRQWDRAFLDTFAAFGPAFRRLWKHGLVSTLAIAMLLANIAFLSGQPSPLAFAMLAAQVGLLLAAIPYHLALAVTRDPKAALVLAFGSWKRGALLLGTAVAAPIVALPLALGPLLFGPTMPLLVALHLAREEKDVPTQPGSA